MAVRACMEAGVGARFALRIGGKSGVASGDPVDLDVTVKGLADAVTQRFGEAPVAMGQSAWVAADGIDLVLTSLRTQVFHPEGMTKLGLDLAARKLVIVKSTQHFHAGFAPMAKSILYAAPPGALRPDFEAIPYGKPTTPYWPKTANPFAGGQTSSCSPSS
jgi:microcystin degradation protein MlrC